MNREISKRDWEKLSAYLDGQLSAKKLACFESRLSQEPLLQDALHELTTTQQVLRITPRLRPPRNFFLTLEMVGKPRRLPNLAPAFGWSSAVASLLFLFVLIGGFLSTGEAIPVAVIDIPQSVSFRSEPNGINTASQSAGDSVAFDAAAAGGLSEAVEVENMEGEFVSEVAVTHEMEAAAKEPAPEMPAALAEIPTLAEEPSPQPDTEIAAEAPLEEEAVSVASEMITDTTRSTQPEEFISASTVLSPTLTETLPVQEGGHHIEKTATKEVAVFEPAVVTATVLPPTLPQVEVPDFSLEDEDSAPEVEPEDGYAMYAGDSASEADQGEAISQEQAQLQAAEHKTSNIFLGVEVLLVLLAFGAGIAWVYLHRRGG